ncbi:peptidoglycan-binding protein [Pseudomonas sp. PH1b]|uniref:peptidoglycan-binding domain-containing protein n=1 Tax=Pseudomonas sp. PH1b TaxID=1397282 RepID=UPI000468547C|nr:peptidoglycan-binding domain-containing protein [Pseudomonas sp. PH1b]
MARHVKYLAAMVLFAWAFELSACLFETATACPLAEEVVGKLQQALAERNYYQGTIDGVVGEKTAEAIFLFQLDCELPLTGSLNSQVLQRLDIRPPSWLSE